MILFELFSSFHLSSAGYLFRLSSNLLLKQRKERAFRVDRRKCLDGHPIHRKSWMSAALKLEGIPMLMSQTGFQKLRPIP